MGARAAAGDDWISAEERRLICDADAHPFPAPAGTSIRWVHVPKTGTSFMNTVWHYGCDVPRHASAADYAGFYERNFNRDYPLKEHCAHLVDHTPATHKPVGPDEWRAHAGHFVTMLREPSSRVLSAYKHGRHCIQDCSPEVPAQPTCTKVRDSRRNFRCKSVAQARSVQQYASLSAVQGCTAKMLTGRACNDPEAVSREEQAAAVERLRGGFAFVGLVEEWELSVCLFHRLLGGTPLPLEFQAVRQAKRAFDERLLRKLGEVVDGGDGPVYAAGRERFQRDVRAVLKDLTRRRATVLLGPPPQAP